MRWLCDFRAFKSGLDLTFRASGMVFLRDFNFVTLIPPISYGMPIFTAPLIIARLCSFVLHYLSLR